MATQNRAMAENIFESWILELVPERKGGAGGITVSNSVPWRGCTEASANIGEGACEGGGGGGVGSGQDGGAHWPQGHRVVDVAQPNVSVAQIHDRERESL